jgi:hypothetical protein
MEENAECMLVIIGATPEGKKELLGFQVGLRESAQSWHELLADIKGRGLSVPPEIAVGPSHACCACTAGQRTVPWGSGTRWTRRSLASGINAAALSAMQASPDG